MLTTNSHSGIFELILNASFLVKLVLLLLFTASIGSWTLMFLKRGILRLSNRQNQQFLQGFWGGWNISEAYSRAADYPFSPVAKSFQAAIRELRRIPENQNIEKGVRSEIVFRTLKKTAISEIAGLEHSLSWLATIASSAPFVGLFGTVWGIMNSFQAIGAAGSANLAAVAPGISEALIATAIGLLAAIPASIGYNFLMGKIRDQATEIDTFAQDLLNLLQREGAI